MVNNVKTIEKVSKDWTLTLPQRQELYKCCFEALCKVKEHQGAFNTGLAYLKLHQKSKDDEIKKANIDKLANKLAALAI